jgi:hypothetical protein
MLNVASASLARKAKVKQHWTGKHYTSNGDRKMEKKYTQFTVAGLAATLQVENVIANGFVVCCSNLGLAEDVGVEVRPDGTKGRPSTVWQLTNVFDLPEQTLEFKPRTEKSVKAVGLKRGELKFALRMAETLTAEQVALMPDEVRDMILKAQAAKEVADAQQDAAELLKLADAA